MGRSWIICPSMGGMIYQGCEILEAHRRQAAFNGRLTVSYEDVMDLLTAVPIPK